VKTSNIPSTNEDNNEEILFFFIYLNNKPRELSARTKPRLFPRKYEYIPTDILKPVEVKKLPQAATSMFSKTSQIK
jgi:hypothetical protein